MLITFDLDGVLIKNPFKEGVFPEVKSILKAQFIELHGYKPELDKEVWKEIMEVYRQRLNSSKPYLAYDWDGVIQQAAESLGCYGGIDVEKLVIKYCRYPYIRQINNSDTILKRLKHEEVRLVVVTNGYYKYQFPVLQALKLNSYFDKIISPEKTKSIKPETSIFLQAYQSGETWYHIGDTLSHDVCGANQAGALSIWIVKQLPDSLKGLNPDERSVSEEGIKFCREQLQKEIIQNIIFEGFSPGEIRPKYIVQFLEELYQFIYRSPSK